MYSTPIPRHSLYLSGTKGVFKVTDPWPTLLEGETPMLLDRSNTPRKATRQITMDRNYSSRKWLYTKGNLDNFNPELSNKEKERSRQIRKIMRKEDKLKAATISP